MEDLSLKNNKIIINTVAIHIFHLVVFFSMLYIFHKYNLMVVSTSGITQNNFLVQLLYHLATMILFPILVIIFCRTKMSSLCINKTNKWLCAVLLSVYISFFFSIHNFTASGLYNAVYILISVAFGEELFFRGWSYLRLKQYSPKLAIIISGSFFGASHVIYPAILNDWSILQIITYGLFGGAEVSTNILGGIIGGLMFILLLELGENLLVPVLIHALLNYSAHLNFFIQWLGILICLLTFIYLIVKWIVIEKKPLTLFKISSS